MHILTYTQKKYIHIFERFTYIQIMNKQTFKYNYANTKELIFHISITLKVSKKSIINVCSSIEVSRFLFK